MKTLIKLATGFIVLMVLLMMLAGIFQTDGPSFHELERQRTIENNTGLPFLGEWRSRNEYGDADFTPHTLTINPDGTFTKDEEEAKWHVSTHKGNTIYEVMMAGQLVLVMTYDEDSLSTRSLMDKDAKAIWYDKATP